MDIDELNVPIETRKFWPSGGACLRKSILKVPPRLDVPVRVASTPTF